MEISLLIDGEKWRRVKSLTDAGPDDRVFTLAIDSDESSATLRFGDGVRGRRPPTGTGKIRRSYRTGEGQAGNLKLDWSSADVHHGALIVGFQGREVPGRLWTVAFQAVMDEVMRESRTPTSRGDFTETPRDDSHYSGVRMQQGRVELDEDFCELWSTETALCKVLDDAVKRANKRARELQPEAENIMHNHLERQLRKRQQDDEERQQRFRQGCS